MSSAKLQPAITLSPGMMIWDQNPPAPTALDWTNWRNAALQNRLKRIELQRAQFFPHEYLLDGLVEAKKTCLYCRSLVPSRAACTQCGAAL